MKLDAKKKLTKRAQENKAKLGNLGASYKLEAAIDTLKSLKKLKFDESIDVAINLGVDARKSDQNVRGAVVLPHGTGRTVRVVVFAQGPKATEAKDAGADIVGFEDLVEKIKGGFLEFDVVIAMPDAMRLLGPLAKVLGPKGLMPNPKVGTVTADPAKAVKEAKAGRVTYRTDKAGIVHCSIGKKSFDTKALVENMSALVTAVHKAKPSSAKGVYLKSMAVSSTMGPGLKVDVASVEVGK